MKLDRWEKIAGLIATILGIIVMIVTLSDTIREKVFPPPPAPIVQPTEPLRGMVDNGKGDPVADARVQVEELPKEQQMTTSDGDFYFSRVPGKPGDRVRVRVSKPGYRDRDEFAALPGPIRIHLEPLQ